MVCGHNRRHWRSVERCLGVGICGQPWPSAWPCRPTTWLWSTSSTVDPSEPVPDRPRYLPCQPPSLGHGSVWPVPMRTAADDDAHHRRLPADKVRRRAGGSSWGCRRCRPLASEYGDESIREMKMTTPLFVLNAFLPVSCSLIDLKLFPYILLLCLISSFNSIVLMLMHYATNVAFKYSICSA